MYKVIDRFLIVYRRMKKSKGMLLMTMKRKMIALVLAMVMVLTGMQIPVNATTTTEEPIESAFTDAAFLDAVREVVGKTNGEHIYPSDVEGITELDVTSYGIENLDGIEFFTSLKEFYCLDNAFVSLELSSPSLEILVCSFNEFLVSIDVTECPQLTTLDCNNTEVQRLDIRNNTKLTTLLCYETQLRTLNVSHNVLLEKLKPWGSHLVNLDVSRNTKLTTLDCRYNDMDAVDCVIGLENCPGLTGNSFKFEPQNTEPVTESFTDEKFLDIVREAIEKPTGDIYPDDLVDVTNLNVNNSGLTSLDGIEYMTSLENLDCTSNHLGELDLYSNKELKSVQCADNDLTDLDLSGNAELTVVNASHNALFSINLSHSPLVEEIDVTSNGLSSLNLTTNTKLKNLYCSNNAIRSIDKIHLPVSINSNLPQNVTTSFNPISANGFTIEFLPQSGAFFDVKMNTSGKDTLSVWGKGAKNSKVKVYDVTNKKPVGIPDSYWKEGELLDPEDSGTMPFINQLINSGLYLGEIESKTMNFSKDFSLGVNRREEYKMFAVHFTRLGEMDGAKLVTVKSNLVYVTSFKFANGSDTKDLLSEKVQKLDTHSYSTFTVTLANSEVVNNVYVDIDRQFRNFHHVVELKKVDKGKYQGKFLISGSETTGWAEFHNYNINTSLTVQCTYLADGENGEKHDLCERYARLAIDPSGYIYEGVPSNKLCNVKTSLYYMDRDGIPIEWDASEYDQINPIFTEEDGEFEWFVPFGLWQVKAEREGYETYYTDWMRVPPAQMDVNFGLISTERPVIDELFAYPDLIEINLNKYVYAEDISAETVTVYVDNQKIQGEIGLVNAEVDTWQGSYDINKTGGTGNRLVSKLRFFQNERIPLGSTVKVCLDKDIRSYAGVTTGNDSSKEALVAVRPEKIVVGGSSGVMGTGGVHKILYGKTATLETSILPLEASVGKNVIITTDSPAFLSLPQAVLVNENGLIKIPMTGLMLGRAEVTLTLEGSNLSNSFTIDIDVP